MGSALTVPLGRIVNGPGDVRVRVMYGTRESKALQWLDPQYVAVSCWVCEMALG